MTLTMPGADTSLDETKVNLTPEQAYNVARVAASFTPAAELEDMLRQLAVLELAAQYRATLLPIVQPVVPKLVGPRGGLCRHDRKPRVCGKKHR